MDLTQSTVDKSQISPFDSVGITLGPEQNGPV